MSALIHEQIGFKALGTTSWGIANTLGYKDGKKISFNDLKHVVEKILKVIKIPLSVDIESGYSKDSSIISENVLTLAKMGCAGVNLEDSIPNQGLKNIEEFSKIIKQVKTDLLNNGFNDFYLNIRIDTYLNLESPLEETINRAKIYEQAGADGVFVPILQNHEEIKELLKHITIPLNVMSLPSLTDIKSLFNIGVKRFSYGNAMSDVIIAKIEELGKTVLSDLSTECLYQHSSLQTQFK